MAYLVIAGEWQVKTSFQIIRSLNFISDNDGDDDDKDHLMSELSTADTVWVIRCPMGWDH